MIEKIFQRSLSVSIYLEKVEFVFFRTMMFPYKTDSNFSRSEEDFLKLLGDCEPLIPSCFRSRSTMKKSSTETEVMNKVNCNTSTFWDLSRIWTSKTCFASK